MVKVEILGVQGSKKTNLLKEHMLKVIADLDLQATMEEVWTPEDLIRSNIKGTPALRLNGKVLLQKEVPDFEEIRTIVLNALNFEKANSTMQNIIVPTDFSTAAQTAYRFAVELASNTQASIVLVHSYLPENDPSFPYLGYNDPEFIKEKEELLEEFRMSIFQEDTPPALDIRKISTELLSGTPESSILEKAQTTDGALIILGTKGKGGLFKQMFGSVSIFIARNAICPVMLIPESASYKSFQQVALAADLDTNDEFIFLNAIQGLKLQQPELHSVHIDSGSKLDYHLSSDKSSKLVIDPDTSLNLRSVTIESHDLIFGMNHYILAHNIDLLVMSTVHRSFVENLFHQSVTKRMALNTKIPLLVMHF